MQNTPIHKPLIKRRNFFYLNHRVNITFIKCLLLTALFNFYKAEGYNNYMSGSRQAALANCGVTITDLWSVSHNQAGIAYIKSPVTGFYHERKFLLKELSFSSVAAVIPTNPGSFGFNLNYFGYSKYYESKIGIGFGKKLGENFAAGVQLDYFITFISGAEKHLQKITYEIGILSYPLKDFVIGVHLFNPIPEKPEHNSINKLPSYMKFGISYSLREKVLLAVETYKEFSEKLILKTGIEYFPVRQFALRMGVSTEPSQYSFGFGYYSKMLWAGLAFTNHQILGLTPHLDVGVSF